MKKVTDEKDQDLDYGQKQAELRTVSASCLVAFATEIIQT